MPDRPSVCQHRFRKMSVINMAKNIKQVHPNSVICYKVGAFYHCYGKDAYIISCTKLLVPRNGTKNIERAQ